MVHPDSLAALVDSYLRAIGMPVTEAAKRAGLSYRQMHRIISGESVYIQPSTIDGLERLGLDRRRLVLAAFGKDQGAPHPTPQEQEERLTKATAGGKPTDNTSHR